MALWVLVSSSSPGKFCNYYVLVPAMTNVRTIDLQQPLQRFSKKKVLSLFSEQPLV